MTEPEEDPTVAESLITAGPFAYLCAALASALYIAGHYLGPLRVAGVVLGSWLLLVGCAATVAIFRNGEGGEGGDE